MLHSLEPRNEDERYHSVDAFMNQLNPSISGISNGGHPITLPLSNTPNPQSVENTQTQGLFAVNLANGLSNNQITEPVSSALRMDQHEEANVQNAGNLPIATSTQHGVVEKPQTMNDFAWYLFDSCRNGCVRMDFDSFYEATKRFPSPSSKNTAWILMAIADPTREAADVVGFDAVFTFVSVLYKLFTYYCKGKSGISKEMIPDALRGWNISEHQVRILLRNPGYSDFLDWDQFVQVSANLRVRKEFCQKMINNGTIKFKELEKEICFLP
ncbi:hypothetical protein HDV01_007553 [Terramyces sp. JEL0728]|nr:hypothetical protein HDV01_007553 [Terramyces sp. JEL0728]